MPGKHADGYLAAYQRAMREAASRWRRGEVGGQDAWRRLLDEELARRPQPDSD